MNIEQHNFITQYLRHNSAYTAYCIAYNVKDQSQYESIMAAANQLMEDPEVGGVIRSVLEGVRHDVEQEIRAQQKTELLTIQRKRELLANIATGEMYAIQNYKGKDCNQCTQMVRPTINQMLKAIDLDNKMAGHYSVDKRQFTKSENMSETQQNATNEAVAPLLFLGGENYEQRTAVCNSGEVDSRTTKTQQNTTKEQSSLPGRGLGKAEKTPFPITEKGSENIKPPISCQGDGLGVGC